MIKTSFAKKAILGTVGVCLLGLTACENIDVWLRVKEAQTVSIVSVDFNPSFTAMSGDSGSGDVGIGEAAGMLGGLFGGNAGDKVKEAMDERAERENLNSESKAAMEATIVESVSKALVKSRFEYLPFETLSGISVTDGGIAASLADESGADIVISLQVKTGYNTEDRNFGLSKAYGLSMNVVAHFADAEGYIGHKTYNVNSNTKKQSDSGAPAFSAKEFNALKKNLITKVRADLLSLKLK